LDGKDAGAFIIGVIVVVLGVAGGIYLANYLGASRSQ
jgi:ABC-type phosphate transport system permease subunit